MLQCAVHLLKQLNLSNDVDIEVEFRILDAGIIRRRDETLDDLPRSNFLGIDLWLRLSSRQQEFWWRPEPNDCSTHLH